MKTFILKIAVLCTLLLTILTVSTYVLDLGLRKTEYHHYKEWNAIYQSKINSDMLIMGNSRAYHHVSPTIIDSVLQVNSFNMGMDAAQFDLQYARFMAYMRTNKKPNVILQNIDEWTLSSSPLYIREQYIPYYEDTCLLRIIKETEILPREYFIYPLKYMGSSRESWKIGLLEFLNIKHFDNEKYKGYLPDHFLFQAQAFDKKIVIPDILVDERIERLFETYLSFCKENDITVICFYAPLYKDGYSEKSHRKTISYYRNILSKYNISILDFAQMPLSDNTIYFRNLSHLREVGANIFTTKLAEQVDSIVSKK